MTKRTGGYHISSFKAKVATIALNDEKLLSDIAKELDGHAKHIQTWRNNTDYILQAKLM